MSENNVVEAEFEEVQAGKGTSEDHGAAQEGPQVAAEITIQVLSDGQIALKVNEEIQKLEPAQIEGVVKNVYEQLHDQRIATTALELLKARLG